MSGEKVKDKLEDKLETYGDSNLRQTILTIVLSFFVLIYYIERNIKEYKTEPNFKRSHDPDDPENDPPINGTGVPTIGDLRENRDPPLSAAEIDAHRRDYWMINHFRQSYEYNLPGRSPHRADTLRPIGYGLMTNHFGFDSAHRGYQ